MSSLFGWSYPPGCSGPPDGDDGPCLCCGQAVDNCICPECPECGEQGNPECYERHGLTYSEEQKTGIAEMERRIREEAEAEAKYWENYKDPFEDRDPDEYPECVVRQIAAEQAPGRVPSREYFLEFAGDQYRVKIEEECTCRPVGLEPRSDGKLHACCAGIDDCPVHGLESDPERKQVPPAVIPMEDRLVTPIPSLPIRVSGPYKAVGRKIFHHTFDDRPVATVHVGLGLAADAETKARLFAAAPTMAEALQAIIKILDGSQPIDPMGALIVARSALNKAIGKDHK